MATTKNLADLRNSIEATPLFVALESTYLKGTVSPLSESRTVEEQYDELVNALYRMYATSFMDLPVTGVRDFPFTTLFSLSEMVILSLVKSNGILFRAMAPDYSEHYIESHTLNVALLCCALGFGMGYTYKEVSELGVAALLHDIGMTQIDPESYLHSGVLSDADRKLVEEHPETGAWMLDKLKGDFPWLLRVVFEEHKRELGQGYPGAVKGELHPYSRIVGLCDTFEALTHHRSYRKAYHPADAMKVIMAARGVLFSQETIRVMIETLSMFPVGSIVELNNKKTAVVVDSVWRSPFRPVIRIIHENDSEPAETVDLSKDSNLNIVGIVYSEDYQLLNGMKLA